MVRAVHLQIMLQLKKIVNLLLTTDLRFMSLPLLKPHTLPLIILISIVLAGALPFQAAYGQLSASFTLNRESGCRPLTVQFTNTTTGAGPDAIYSWNFGNGNTSTLQNPGATYLEEKTYTVTLTVTWGGSTSTATREVVVYKTPTVDFTATPTSGCMPLEVGFKANASAGDGTITRYFWDYGDGKTEESATLEAPKHTYTQAQQAPVSLTITNSFGCYNTRTYSGLVTVFEEVVVDFAADKQTVCKLGDAVNFINKSKGGTLTTYHWDFGDGNTSNLQNPTHIYSKEGAFTVTLKATNSKGCTSEKTATAFIRVGAFGQHIHYNKESVKCVEGSTTFYAKYNGEDYNFRVKWLVNNQHVSGSQEHTYGLMHYEPGKYTIRAEFDFNGCKLSDSTKIEIFPKPPLKGIVLEGRDNCEAPFTYTFSDTTPGATKWSWVFWDVTVPTEKRSLRSFSHTFPFEATIQPTVFLSVENEHGCVSQVSRHFSLVNTKVKVEVTNVHTNAFKCKERIYTFKGGIMNVGNDDFVIDSLEWNFGDTIIRGTNEPTYQFKNSADTKIYFKYKTKNGCSGTVEYLMQPVWVADSLDFDIIPKNEVCGNNLVQLVPKGIAIQYGQFLDQNWQPFPFVKDLQGVTLNYYQFNTAGPQIIHMIIKTTNSGYCNDTVTKVIHVKPPFSGIGKIILPCDGDRGLVKFADISKGATFWEWDFGDGTKKTFHSKPDTVEHHYKANGIYKVYQRVKFENCEVLDSAEVRVFLKQKPIISILGDSICQHVYSHPLRLTIADSSSATERIAADYYHAYEVLHYPGGYSRGVLGITGGYRNGTIANIYPDSAGFTSLRVVLHGLGCSDTSDLIPFKIKGPSVHFSVQEHHQCFNDTIKFVENSSGNLNVPIVKWEWDFGNGIKTIKNAGGNFGFRYDAPGKYYPHLKVTDADGCHAETYGSFDGGGELRIEGPKAIIGAPATTIALNSTIQFKNISLPSFIWGDYGNYIWHMPDGTIIKAFEPPGYLFNKEGDFEIKLVSTNPFIPCIDSTTLKIKVVVVNAKFTHTISYVNNNGCPPALVSFKSTSVNAVRYGWNFGNGATAGNQSNVSHTYHEPGVYKVWHYTWDENNNVDSTFDIIEIKGPYAIISANRMVSCNNLDVTLSADVKNAASFTWDFGDGSISSAPSTTVNHRYLTAGIYTPSLVLQDNEGCKAISQLSQPLIVDSLRVDFEYQPTGICAGGVVQLSSTSQSFSSTRLGTPLQYEWSMHGNTLAAGSNPVLAHSFATAGSYAVSLQVQTAYGCNTSVVKTFAVQPPLQAVANGPTSICIGDSATFTASSVGNPVQYRWYLASSTMVTGPATPRMAMQQTGNFTGWLAASNGACTDSVSFNYTVHGLPQVAIIPANPRLCHGDTLTLTVSSTGSLQWQAATTLQPTANGAQVWPTTDTRYQVQATSQDGCTTTDTVRVQVVQPLSVKVSPDVQICAGASATLTASGAASYQWLPVAGLSQPGSATSLATPTITTRYTLTASDAFGCFTDTASVLVTVNPLPQIDNIANKTVNGGESFDIRASANIPVQQWAWTPATYLSCANCPNPTIRPLNDIAYTVTATTAAGCKSSVSFEVKVLCSKERIFIPNAFTPNADGLNDRFRLLGGGVTMVRYLRITDRWGQTIFERKMVPFGSKEASWDGNYPNGSAAPSGNYIYMAELECSTGETFRFDGSLRLLR